MCVLLHDCCCMTVVAWLLLHGWCCFRRDIACVSSHTCLSSFGVLLVLKQIRRINVYSGTLWLPPPLVASCLELRTCYLWGKWHEHTPIVFGLFLLKWAHEACRSPPNHPRAYGSRLVLTPPTIGDHNLQQEYTKQNTTANVNIIQDVLAMTWANLDYGKLRNWVVHKSQLDNMWYQYLQPATP